MSFERFAKFKMAPHTHGTRTSEIVPGSIKSSWCKMNKHFLTKAEQKNNSCGKCEHYARKKLIENKCREIYNMLVSSPIQQSANSGEGYTIKELEMMCLNL